LLGHHFERAAGLGDLFLGRSAERMRVNGKLVREFAITKNLDARQLVADETVSAQQIRGDRFSRWEDVKFFQIQHGVFGAERIVKSTLRHAAMKGHLTALKTATTRIAATRLLALVAGAGGLAELRAHTAADANFLDARTARRPKSREAERRRAGCRLGLFLRRRLAAAA